MNEVHTGIMYSLTKSARYSQNTGITSSFPSNWGDFSAVSQQAKAPLMESPSGVDFEMLQGGRSSAPVENKGIKSDLSEWYDNNITEM